MNVTRTEEAKMLPESEKEDIHLQLSSVNDYVM